ncbi:chromate transporter [Thermobrachium celere]|uniref:Chromate transport protein n=1 Tax=Thermobrachium celere DSM 8682 TaxID=941824 RepID=R7RPK5_9CLOT|nr:chromate transporter [Thermobrachium celere]CDF57306.1 Chromate transport protein [Thermobrachium celere DSM 8682]
MLFELFMSFAKIGAFTLGGGYAMVPLIQEEVVEKKKWIDREEFLDILAVSQSTPGALAINMSVYIGYRLRGVLGSIFAALGCVLPSFLSIIFIAAFLTNFLDYKYVKKFFQGAGPAVAALILYSAAKIGKTKKFKWYYYIITILTVILMFFKVDPIIIILSSAVLGIFIRGEKDGV